MKLDHFNFSKESSFVFDLREKNYINLIKDIKDMNMIKPNDEDISFLNDIIFEYKLKNNDCGNDSYEDAILPDYKIALINFSPGIKTLNEKMKAIIDIFYGFKLRENLSLKKICNKYYKISGKNISKTYVSNILKNKLNIRFLKTTPKTSKLNSNSSKIRGYIFLKIVLNALKLGLKIIYIDESNFQVNNNHLKIWRKRGEIPFPKCNFLA